MNKRKFVQLYTLHTLIIYYRKERNRHAAPKVTEPSIGAEVQCALCWAVRGTLLLWLLMLTWICAALYDQVTTMKVDIAKGKFHIFFMIYFYLL